MTPTKKSFKEHEEKIIFQFCDFKFFDCNFYYFWPFTPESESGSESNEYGSESLPLPWVKAGSTMSEGNIVKDRDCSNPYYFRIGTYYRLPSPKEPHKLPIIPCGKIKK
jgi:hypothetical protein